MLISRQVPFSISLESCRTKTSLTQSVHVFTSLFRGKRRQLHSAIAETRLLAVIRDNRTIEFDIVLNIIDLISQIEEQIVANAKCD